MYTPKIDYINTFIYYVDKTHAHIDTHINPYIHPHTNSITRILEEDNIYINKTRAWLQDIDAYQIYSKLFDKIEICR